ncbi:hypothetical protein D3C75_655080 [compost metagenome]
MLLSQGGDSVGNGADQSSVGWIFHVENRAHMQYASVDMAKHAVLQFIAVQQRTELLDEIRKIFWRYSGVLYEWLWPGFTLDVAQQPDSPFAHGVDALQRIGTNGKRMAQAHHGGIALQVQDKVMNALLDSGFIVAAELYEVDAQGRCAWIFGEVFSNAMPDDVLHRQH